MAEPIYHLTKTQLNEALRGAIGMYLEYRDIHGHSDDEAQIDGANEILDGLNADLELAASDPTERLRLQLPDVTADLVAALERKLELEHDHRRFDLDVSRRESHRAWLNECQEANDDARAAIEKARGAR